MSTIRILTGDEVRRAVSMKEAIALMHGAFAELSKGEAIVPQRINMDMRPDNSLALIMPVYSPGRKRYATKIVSLSSNNPRKGLPFIHGLLLVFDSNSGIPLALMDAEYVTALRTGAASGLATDLLARRDSEVGVIFGSGGQARTQIAGINSVRNLKKIYVFSPVKSDAERFAVEVSKELNVKITVVDSPHIVSEADIICTATTSETPVFADSDLKPGVHINGIGSYKPTLREIPSETIKRAKVIVDSRSAALQEAGDLVIPINEGIIKADHIHAELGEIVMGRRASRISEKEITLFKSVGNAVQDLAVAARVLEVAEKLSLGKHVTI